MSRFLKVMIVLLTIAAMATPVLADERLRFAGEMRVRGWHQDVDGDPNGTSTWADQRLRIGGKFSVAEGVSVTFRFDATESNWGSQPGFGGGRLVNNDTSMQWDRAHLDLEQGNLHLRAGQQFVKFGNSGFDAQDNGLTLNVKGQIPVSLFFMVDNNYGDISSSDAYFYGLSVGHRTDSYASTLFAAGHKLNGGSDEEVYVIGGTYATAFNGIQFNTELEYFFGDANATDDAYGFQLFADASIAATDIVTVGGQFYYAMGDDDDVQYSLLGNGFDGWDPVFNYGTGLENEQISFGGGNPYQVLGNGAGLIAGRLYASVKATDDITLGASVLYGVDDEGDVAEYKDVLALGAGLSYAVMSNTKLGLQLQYSEYSKTNATAEDLEVFQAGVGLFVTF